MKTDIKQSKWEEDIRGKICEIISEMLDNPDKYGIYPTTKCYDRLEQFIKDLLKEERIKTLEEVRTHAMTQYVSYRDFESIIDRMINNLKN